MPTEALSRRTSRQTTPSGKLQFSYKAASAKKSSSINTAVITVLKDAVNRFNGHIDLIDITQ